MYLKKMQSGIVNLVLFIACIRSCSTPKGSAAITSQKTPAYYLPVAIDYSKTVQHLPDSVVDFIKVNFQSKGIQVTDTVEINNLQQAEMGRLWRENVKKGDPPPDLRALDKRMITRGYSLHISVFRSPETPEYKIDSLRGSAFFIPFNFEKIAKYGSFCPDRVMPAPVYTTLKIACDKIHKIQVSLLAG